MADFFQTGPIPTLHRLGPPNLELLEERLLEFSLSTPLALILPCHVDDLAGPALAGIVRTLSRVPYFSRVVVGLDGASRGDLARARSIFSPLTAPPVFLWNDGPEIRGQLSQLAEIHPAVLQTGKGRNLWLCAGFLLADQNASIAAVHDCDILTYNNELPARLIYPVAHPALGFDFCKGYSARFTDRLNGRVMRLLFTPLIRSLKSIFGEEHFLQFLDTFRYPLSGEVCFDLEIARRCRIPSDWGVEVGMLAEVFRTVSSKVVCQVEFNERYDHKHQDLSSQDPTRGLNKMAVDISNRIFQTMAGRGMKLDRGVFDTLLSAYRVRAEDAMRCYAADAEINHLQYFPHEEELAVSTFTGSIQRAASLYLENPLGSPMLPSWNQVESAHPGFLFQFRRKVLEDNAYPRETLGGGSAPGIKDSKAEPRPDIMR